MARKGFDQGFFQGNFQGLAQRGWGDDIIIGDHDGDMVLIWVADIDNQGPGDTEGLDWNWPYQVEFQLDGLLWLNMIYDLGSLTLGPDDFDLDFGLTVVASTNVPGHLHEWGTHHVVV